MKSIKISDYFELIKPKYTYIKIIPDKSIRNYNSTNIAKAISHTWKNLNRRIKREQKKIFFETNFKISYIIDIKSNNASFYFLVPKPFVSILVEKIREIWSKATIEEVERIEGFSDNSITYQLTYKKEDALSIAVDKKSNEPLNSILNVIDIMKDTDRITIIYNFLPRTQFSWLKQYNDTMQKIKDKKPIEREKFSVKYILKYTVCGVVDILQSVIDVLNDFLGNNQKTRNKALFEVVADVLEEQKSLSAATKRKKDLNVIDTQIAVVSESEDKTRQENNALAVCQSFRVLDEDNELVYKKVNSKIDNVEKYRFDKIDIITTSIDECQNFVQIPGRTLLKQFNIKYIQTTENPVPQKLRNGYIELGSVKCKGNTCMAYLEDEYDVGNLPLCLIGSQGSGKTTYISNYFQYINRRKEGGLLLDFIKNCELSNSIERIIPKDDLVVLDLSKEECIQGFGFNEIKINDDMSIFQKLKLANLQAQQTMNLVDAINNDGTPLTSKMRRYLSASANVVYANGITSIREVINCLEDFSKRSGFIKSLNEEIKVQLNDEIQALKELDEIDKKSGEIIGTKDSKIEGILDRVNLLKEDFKLKFMFNKDCHNNIDLVELMEAGKIVLIKMPESEFPLSYVKNVLVTYWVSKMWLSSQIRGSIHDKPRRTHTVIDEVFQAPTCMRTLKYILPQSRKFGNKFIFSIQYLKQIDEMEESLHASGSSYMFLKGAKEDDFNKFKAEFEEYEYEDLRDMEKYSSLNLIYYSGGYTGFISKLPAPIM